MASNRRKRNRASARRAAEAETSGFTSTTVQIPSGLSYFEMKPGTYDLDIVEYEVGKGNERADEGQWYYERTFFVYKNIGVKEQWFCSLADTFNKKDPIAEWRNREARSGNADPDMIKALKPKKRQLFLVYDREDKKLKLWDVSTSLFGELLNKRIKNSRESQGWDQFFSSDDDGMTLQIVIETAKSGSWSEAVSIDFLPRETPLPEAIIEHGYCLDDCLVETPYAELKRIFDGEDAEPEQDEGAFEPEPEPEKEAPPKKEEKPRHLPTAEDFGFKKADSVSYKGGKCTIMKISPDGTSLTLEDDATEELIRAVAPEECSTWEEVEESKEPEESKEEPQSEKKETAASAVDEEWGF